MRGDGDILSPCKVSLTHTVSICRPPKAFATTPKNHSLPSVGVPKEQRLQSRDEFVSDLLREIAGDSASLKTCELLHCYVVLFLIQHWCLDGIFRLHGRIGNLKEAWDTIHGMAPKVLFGPSNESRAVIEALRRQTNDDVSIAALIFLRHAWETAEKEAVQPTNALHPVARRLLKIEADKDPYWNWLSLTMDRAGPTK